MNKCLNCGIDTTNPKYCGKSCSATATNKTHVKVKRKNKCAQCEIPIRAGTKYCKECFQKSLEDKRNITLAEFKAKDESRHPSYYRGHVNFITRALNKHREQVCQHCGYNKHIEYCHIKPLSEFPEDVPVSIISDPSNILILCRNCHWELDHK